MKTTLVTAGGFLGAGKTSLVVRAAAALRAQGERVVLANDRRPSSSTRRSAGAPTAEVAGARFGRAFPGFATALRPLAAGRRVGARTMQLRPRSAGACSPRREMEETMKKEITVRDFVDELVARIDESRGIDCCKEEIKELARLAQREIPDRKLMVTWK